MTVIRSLNFVLGMLLLLSPLTLSQTIGPCHPFPGAVAKDCLQLISDNLGNDATLTCKSGGPAVTISLRNCSITTKCGERVTEVTRDDVVRRALTTIGACALNDLGSISGSYTAADGTKTCYLYPGQ